MAFAVSACIRSSPCPDLQSCSLQPMCVSTCETWHCCQPWAVQCGFGSRHRNFLFGSMLPASLRFVHIESAFSKIAVISVNCWWLPTLHFIVAFSFIFSHHCKLTSSFSSLLMYHVSHEQQRSIHPHRTQHNCASLSAPRQFKALTCPAAYKPKRTQKTEQVQPSWKISCKCAALMNNQRIISVNTPVTKHAYTYVLPVSPTFNQSLCGC